MSTLPENAPDSRPTAESPVVAPGAAVTELIEAIDALRARIVAAEQAHAERLDRVADRHRASARNLVHYVTLRGEDLRPLQDALSAVGLSSLGRMEAGVLGHLDAVRTALHPLGGRPAPDPADDDPLSPAEGRALLAANAESLLGPSRPGRETRIMVTMPSEAATNAALVQGMADAGMDLARVNAAHDGEAAWAAMVANIRGVARDGGRPAPRICMDLAGPKLRTGPLEPGPGVVKVKPRRDVDGTVLERSRVWLGEADAPEAADAVVLPLDPAGSGHSPVLSALRPGDHAMLTDARDSDRTLHVLAATEAGVLLACRKTVYWHTGLEVDTPRGTLVVGALPSVPQAMRVHAGDEIVLTRSMDPRPAVSEGPFTIGCSLPQAFQDVRPGERVLIDDGKITGEVVSNDGEAITLTVTEAGPTGAKLRAEKGVNFPDTDLRLPALTDEDRSHLPFAAAHADVVNMSFVRSPADVAALIDALDAEDARGVGVSLKIETVGAFERLPAMLLEAMRWNDVGVMIARGDLAVEAGFERMAELQEEILWLCEAAHVPAVWATQILETLAKQGLPSRAEITDAAMAQHAEAAMLNKGPYIDEAIGALSDILTRMGGHADKKRDMLRRLRSWSL